MIANTVNLVFIFSRLYLIIRLPSANPRLFVAHLRSDPSNRSSLHSILHLHPRHLPPSAATQRRGSSLKNRPFTFLYEQNRDKISLASSIT